MPYVTKTADKLNVHPGDVVTYTYTVHNNEPNHICVSQIEDDFFGIVWSGNPPGIPPGETFSVEYENIANCTTITNRARAEYEYEP